MKKAMYALIVTGVVVSGLVLANRELKHETSTNSTSKPLTAAERKAALKKWEATPDGIKFTTWKTSPEGQKVLTSAAKLMKHVRDSTHMEAVVISLSLPPGSRLGFGVMVSIHDEEYILSFGPETSAEFQSLRGLKVNDNIRIRSRGVSYAPKYSYAIVAGNYVEHDHKILYKSPPRQGGC